MARTIPSDTPPQSPLFTNAPGATPPTIPLDPWTADERKQIDQLKQLIKDGKIGSKGDPATNDGRGRAQQFYPYLLVRSFTGDNGTRPFNQVFWESPDIWTAVGEPATTPEIPPTHGGVLPAGQPNTIYAHVWNLGRAPLTGVVVTFYWFNPSLAIDAANANLIGMKRVDLGPRNSPLCHQLVKCPKAVGPGDGERRSRVPGREGLGVRRRRRGDGMEPVARPARGPAQRGGGADGGADEADRQPLQADRRDGRHPFRAACKPVPKRRTRWRSWLRS